MGLFSRTAKQTAASPKDQEVLRFQLAEIAKDGRMHARTRMSDLSIVKLQLEPAGPSGPVLDLAYGGVAAYFDKQAFHLAPSATAQGSLQILGQEVSMRVSLVRTAPYPTDPSKVIAGLCIHHELPASLLFMRDFLEPSRCGASLGLIAPQLRPERYRDAQWQCWRGDGPTDLVMHKDSATGQALDAILTFRLNKNYCEVTLKDGVLKTGQTVSDDQHSPLGGAALIASSAELDPTLLRTALYIIAASPQPCRDAMGPFVHHLKEGLTLRSSTHAGTAVR